MFSNQVNHQTNYFRFLNNIIFRRWYSGFVGWSSLVRLRHVTSGLYLAIIGDENGPKVTCISKKNASAIAVTFEMKMSKVEN